MPKFKDGQEVKCIATREQLRQIAINSDLHDYRRAHPTDKIIECDGANVGGSFGLPKDMIFYKMESGYFIPEDYLQEI